MIKIGVVMGSKFVTSSEDIHYATEFRYFNAIEKAGALAIPLIYSNMEEQLKNVDGVLIPGGDYAVPDCYYVKGHESAFKDEGVWFEGYMAFTNYCLEHNIPLLGICAGMQTLGLVLGCKLKADNMSHRIEDSKRLVHSINIEKNTHLSKIFNKNTIMVNSLHQEVLAEISDEVLVSAIADDGLIEAVESKKHNFAIGVQWHPECLLNIEEKSKEQLSLFEYFVQQCKKQ